MLKRRALGCVNSPPPTSASVQQPSTRLLMRADRKPEHQCQSVILSSPEHENATFRQAGSPALANLELCRLGDVREQSRLLSSPNHVYTLLKERRWTLALASHKSYSVILSHYTYKVTLYSCTLQTIWLSLTTPCKWLIISERHLALQIRHTSPRAGCWNENLLTLLCHRAAEFHF